MDPKYKQPFTFDRVVRIIIGVLVTIALFFLVKKLSGVLVPFLLSWLFAYMMYPLVRFYQKTLRVKIRIIAILLAFITFAAAFAGILAITIPPIIQEISRTSNLIGVYIEHIKSTAYLPADMRSALIEWTNKIDLNSLLEKENFSQIAESIAPKFFGLLSNSIDFLISLFVLVIIFLYTIFILIDYEKINSGWLQFIPEKYRHLITNILEDLELGMNKYFRGQALIATIVGTILAVGFEIIDLPLGLLLGVIMGVLTLVPYLSVIMFPALGFFGFLKAIETGQPYWIVLLSVLAVMAVAQLVQDLILTPKIMGKAMGMKPAVILLSLSIWGSLLGVAGMIIALPITTILASYYKQFVIGDGSLTDINNRSKSTKRIKKESEEPTEE